MTAPSLRKLGMTAIAASAAIVLSSHASRAETLVFDGVSLNNAGPGTGHEYAIFTLEQTLGDSDIIAGNSFVEGDFGAAGTGRLSLSGASVVDGNVLFHTGGSVTSSGGSSVTGSKTSGASTDTLLSAGVSDAMNASSAASSLSAAPDAQTPITAFPTTNPVSLTAGGANDRYILTISNFSLSSQTLVLHGDANASFVFNITNTFALSHSSIVLVGGVTANNILFNYTGTSPITLTSANVNGIILAAGAANYQTSTVQMTGGTLNGEIIADKVSLTGGALVQGLVSP